MLQQPHQLKLHVLPSFFRTNNKSLTMIRRRCLLTNTTTTLLRVVLLLSPLSLRVLSSTRTIIVTHAYVTSPSYLPYTRQVAWLKEMTVDICQATPPGQLSNSQLSQAEELMYAWSHVNIPPSFAPSSNKKEFALHVEQLVKRVIDERRAGNEQADVSVTEYNCLLEGWARSGQGVAAAERCEQILETMQAQGPQPDLTSFKATLMAWRQATDKNNNNNNSKKKDDNDDHHHHHVDYTPYRAQRLLEWMIKLYRNGDNVKALPDADCFDIVMQIWSRSGHKNAPEQTEQILGAMERLYQSTQLEKLKPRHSSFNAVLAAWSKSGRPEAADRAIAILSFMELLAKNGDHTIAPDSASYNTVMGAFARSKDQGIGARKADAILRHAEEAYLRDPLHCQLDTILFNTAMGAWSKANKTGAYRKARSILDRQISFYKNGCETCRPDVFGYTSVIASCAAEPGNRETRQKAFNLAMQTYKELNKQVSGNAQPNHVTFGAMLKACARLLPAGHMRNKTVSKIFRECCEAGCVGDMVVSRLREAASPAVYKQLMEGHSKRSLPADWTRNVVEANEYRKRKTVNNHSTRKRKRAEV